MGSPGSGRLEPWAPGAPTRRLAYALLWAGPGPATLRCNQARVPLGLRCWPCSQGCSAMRGLSLCSGHRALHPLTCIPACLFSTPPSCQGLLTAARADTGIPQSELNGMHFPAGPLPLPVCRFLHPPGREGAPIQVPAPPSLPHLTLPPFLC